MSEIVFEVRKEVGARGYSAQALGFGIHTEADSIDELRANANEAVGCYFDDAVQSARLVRFHFVD